MNYIEMCNQLWIVNKEYCFKPSEISLYFHLLDVSNSLGWKNPFKQSNLVICATIGVSEPIIQRSRDNLVRAGLITFKSGTKKGQLTEYTLKNLGIRKLYLNDTLSKHLSNTLSDTQTVVEVDTKVGDINKEDKTKNYIHIGEEKIFDLKIWVKESYKLQIDNWQKLYPLANIFNCLDEFLLKKAFQTFNNGQHFLNSFAYALRDSQKENEKKKDSGKKEKPGKAQSLMEIDRILKEHHDHE